MSQIKKQKYINDHLIKCSYKRKSRFFVIFLALCIPIGLEFLYLERYIAFSIIFIISIVVIGLNSIVFLLNYQINMKSKETAIQNKMNKMTNKKENKVININKDNLCVKRFNIIAKIIAINHILYMIVDIIGHSLGYITD